MQTSTLLQVRLGALVLVWFAVVVQARRSMTELPNKGSYTAVGDPSSSGRRLLQSDNYDDCSDYDGNCTGSSLSGGETAGIAVGCVAAVLLTLASCILRPVIRRKMWDRYYNSTWRQKKTNPGPGASPSLLQTSPRFPLEPPMGASPNQGLQGPNGMYPQASTYPKQAYPQKTGSCNPAPQDPVAGPPTNGISGVQMQTLPHEKPGYESSSTWFPQSS